MRRTRLVLVFPLDLERVEEVGPGGVHLDQVLIGTGDGVREGRNLELARALETSQHGKVRRGEARRGERGKDGDGLALTYFVTWIPLMVPAYLRWRLIRSPLVVRW